MRNPLIVWYRQIWPRPGPRRAVLNEYTAIGQHKYFLADVALRGGVFSPHGRVDNLHEAGRLEGRRELALEIIRIAGEEPGALWRLVERAGTSDGD